MKIRRKTNTCLNCQANLNSVYNYCPNCGQENNDSNVSFQMLIGDFFNTYFALDSKFAKSIKPFFTKPGYLTNRYIEGKRASYAHPIRLYLIISIFYFFIISLIGQDMANDNNNDDSIVSVKNELKNVEGLGKKENKQLSKILSQENLNKIQAQLGDSSNLNDLAYALNQTLDEKSKQKLTNKLDTTSLIKLGLIESPLRDSLIRSTMYTKYIGVDSLDVKSFNNDVNLKVDGEDFVWSKMDWDLLNKYKLDGKITNQQLYDSLKLPEDLSEFEKLVAHQTIRVIRADNEQVVSFILKNLPFMMLFLIPLFALILKLMYIREKSELYIKHLIHALHLHSFAYIIYGISLIIIHYWMPTEEFQLIVGLISFIGVSAYTYFSFLRVYHQKWFKTFLKFNMVGLIYIILISFFFGSELILSMLLF